MPYDSLLLVAFGGPERRDDVMPFLENVTRGRNVPRGRLLEVAKHYDDLGGASPLNGQVRELLAALKPELERRGIALPVYWGNRNWHPMLNDVVKQMADDGMKHALAFVLAAYGSYSSCRQYLKNIADARAAAGEVAPVIDKARLFHNHPLFVAANADRLRDALESLSPEDRAAAHVAFTAHSIPSGMANTSDYEQQLWETSRLVCESLGVPNERWSLAYQSRSGRPQDPWLEPDICDRLAALAERGVRSVAVMPIGFLSDHVEVLFDLDVEAAAKARELGTTMIRAGTVGTHPAFVEMIGELIAERVEPATSERRSIGRFGPAADACPAECCPPPMRRQVGRP
ncbi:MAG: ferrochelatase [Planctomycetaceae bacterium]